jgi:methylmalonyl-CoA/ethylmalonyl-CoA epimerase
MTIEKNVIQVAVAVENLETAIEAWSTFLGREPSKTLVTGPQEEWKTEYRGAPSDARCKLAIYDLGECQVELMEPVGGPSVWADHLEQKGPGVHHIGFRVEGMKEGVRFCDALGMPLLQSGEFGNGRYAYFDSEAQLGTMLELLEFDDYAEPTADSSSPTDEVA